MKDFILDLFKDTDSGGKKKWSFMRVIGMIWFIVADLGSMILYYVKGLVISAELAPLTGVILLGVVGGKSVMAIQSAITQINTGGKS